jgi:cytoskeletal protein RodZ
LLLLLIAAAVLWWKPWQQRAAVNATPVRPADASAAAALTASGAGSDPRADASGDADTGAGVPATGDAAPRDAPPSPATAGSLAAGTTAADNRAAMGAGVVRLRMSFSAESWVDVHDAAGHRVYSGYGQANSVKTLVGDGPLRVYLGFASGVQLEINERAVAIGSAFVHADVARFQAGADGVLRSFANDSRPQG